MAITGDILLSRPVDVPAGPTIRPLVRALLLGAEVESGKELSTGYAVVAFHSTTPCGAIEVASALRSRPGALSLMGQRGGYVLLPCPLEVRAGEIVRDLHARVGQRVWMGVSWAEPAGIANARAVAADLLTLSLAGARDPGVYELRGVLADFAVLRQPAVSSRLVRMIEPVVARSQLLAALRAFLAEDGNRAGAARRLLIHRSTLDYRLRAIQRLTGARPTTPHGVLTLDAALTAHALSSVHPALPPL